MPLPRAGRGLLLRLIVFPCLAVPLMARGQAQTAQQSNQDELDSLIAAASINDSGPEGIIPVQRGLNASLGSSSMHDSSSGWFSLLTPNVAYRLNRHFSVDAGVEMYLYINIDANVGKKAKPVYVYSPKKGVFGDTTLSFEGDADARLIGYEGTFSLGLPSGNTKYGLGAGQVTFNIDNHFERNIGLFTPEIELGYGDASGLVDQRIVQSYVAVGPLAHFQAGTSVYLPLHSSFEADAYEELPLAKDIVYSTTGKGKKRVRSSTNEDPAEDNGFITSLDIPLNPHTTLSGFYSRSLRDHDDVAGFSFTFLLKAPPRTPRIPF